MSETPFRPLDEDDDIRARIPGADAALLRTWRFDLATFLAMQERVRSGSLNPSSSLWRGSIEAPRANDIDALPPRDSDEARALTERGLNALALGSVAVVVVAGGMATRFRGANGPVVKGIVQVVDDESFLDLKIADAQRAAKAAGGPVPIAIMTSFATHAPIERHLRERGLLDAGDVFLFGQSVSLRLTERGDVFGANGSAPLPADSYTTPGHGDFFRALVETGAYGRLRAVGVETVILSNVDNLGASLDPLVVGAFLRARDERGVAMFAETVARADVDGKKVGVVVRADGRLRAMEGFRLPDDVDASAVQNASINTFAFDLAKLANPVPLEVHMVQKEIALGNEKRAALQGELVTCEASALLPFGAVRVEREGRIGRFGDGRFYPVKKPDDLPRVSDLVLASRAHSLPVLQREKHLVAAFRAAFGDDVNTAESVFVMAPGRINLIGEHTDYNDGLVLPAAVDRGIVALAEKRGDGVVEIVSLERAGRVRFDTRGSTSSVEVKDGWGKYARGVVAAFQERGVEVPGLRIALSSDLPQGGGMSSSTALCLAIAKAVSALVDTRAGDLSDDDLAFLGQRAEHLVGVQCGIMDQWSIAHGKKGRALLIDCQSMETSTVPLDLPEHVFLVADTGKVRGHTDTAYNDRRRECGEAVRALSQLTGRPMRSLRDVTREDIDDFGDALDPVLRMRAEHVVGENLRVVAAVAALRSGSVAYLGSLLNASHASLRDKLQVSCEELDAMCDLLREAGVVGARMMGGGFGGCALSVVERAKLDAVIAHVDQAYRRAFSLTPAFWAVEAGDGVRVLDAQ